MASGGRAVPFYCPYCGEEDLVPETPPEGESGSGHGHWSCQACRRAFRLSLTALAVAGRTGSSRSAGPGGTPPGTGTSGTAGTSE